MAKQIEVTGIGRIYRGVEFLGEVLYDLNVANGEVAGVPHVSGYMRVLQPSLRFGKSANNVLRLEDGQTYDITIQFSDDIVGKYKISGDRSRQQI